MLKDITKARRLLCCPDTRSTSSYSPPPSPALKLPNLPPVSSKMSDIVNTEKNSMTEKNTMGKEGGENTGL